ncbi:unnamed protein product [Acanthoscelides obtectus]|uniref:DNA polymerase subunit gamma-1 n=1 Tax=Acanthoscelides obtectus TaxID=200917 RepID=A0A9P0LW08_ACAOB|nr:unnamed protein product [Acanthoscelides obtectus]CAK1644039.1 DNA polymerase subunit gamma-1, mitochondrial [Acanthoscelides obtectus]
MDQMVVWLNKQDLPKELQESTDNFGAIIPQVVVCGTLTRRAVESTWMTASNAHPERIGSELRAMVQAPPGYNIVGADVDSQELWIASVIGDSRHAAMHGCTPLGWMTLSGNKSEGTDMHSVTAKAVGISRDHAKVINYARIYGAGQNFAERLLKQFNPTMSETEARSKARKMFDMTKGKKFYYLTREYVHEFGDHPFTKWQAMELAKAHGKKVSEMFETSKWVGGTESAMFNRLEEIANSDRPTTPFLGTGIWCNTVIEDCCWFFKLPHKDGPSRNVGNPLAKDYLTKFSDNVLAGDTESAEQVLSIARKLSYWRNNRARIMDQMVVWLNKQDLPMELHESTGLCINNNTAHHQLKFFLDFI